MRLRRHENRIQRCARHLRNALTRYDRALQRCQERNRHREAA